MKAANIKVGQLVDFPIEITSDGKIIFNEILSRNRYIADLTTLVGSRGEEKEIENVRLVKDVKLSSFILNTGDVILRARKNAMGLFIWGFRVNKIHPKLKLCSGETFFVMFDGHFEEGKEIQYNLFDPVLNLITRIQKFQFML